MNCRTRKKPLANYYAHMAADAMNALAVFKAPGGMWREYEIARALECELGPNVRRSCAVGTAIRLTRNLAQRDGLPWPSLGEIIDRTIQGET